MNVTMMVAIVGAYLLLKGGTASASTTKTTAAAGTPLANALAAALKPSSSGASVGGASGSGGSGATATPSQLTGFINAILGKNDQSVSPVTTGAAGLNVGASSSDLGTLATQTQPGYTFDSGDAASGVLADLTGTGTGTVDTGNGNVEDTELIATAPDSSGSYVIPAVTYSDPGISDQAASLAIDPVALEDSSYSGMIGDDSSGDSGDDSGN
jgi:hypothetical protein